jgi:hypothetical protein
MNTDAMPLGKAARQGHSFRVDNEVGFVHNLHVFLAHQVGVESIPVEQIDRHNQQIPDVVAEVESPWDDQHRRCGLNARNVLHHTHEFIRNTYEPISYAKVGLLRDGTPRVIE